jgi:hypothetical protein
MARSAEVWARGGTRLTRGFLEVPTEAGIPLRGAWGIPPCRPPSPRGRGPPPGRATSRRPAPSARRRRPRPPFFFFFFFFAVAAAANRAVRQGVFGFATPCPATDPAAAVAGGLMVYPAGGVWQNVTALVGVAAMPRTCTGRPGSN